MEVTDQSGGIQECVNHDGGVLGKGEQFWEIILEDVIIPIVLPKKNR
jgi:hypothetical protein